MLDNYKGSFQTLTDQYHVPIIVQGAENILQNGIVLAQNDSLLHGISSILPAHVNVFCENVDNTDVRLAADDYMKYDKLLFLSSWQYENKIFESMLCCIPDILCRNPFLEILVVLFESRIRTGATDLGSQKKAIEEAYDKYKRYHDNILILKRGESILKVIHPNSYLGDALPMEYHKKFQEWKENLEDESYGLKFELNDILDSIRAQYIDAELLDRHICGFSVIFGSKDITKTYSENFYKRYYTGIEKKILDFYIECVKGICVWNMEKDLAYLKQSFGRMYEKRTLPNIKRVPAPKNRIEYDAMEAEFGMKTEFYSGLQRFYETDIVDFLLEHLQNKANKIENYLKTKL